MFTDEQKDIMQSACGEYGNQQIVVAIEELAELQKELTKSLRLAFNKDHTSEELADVYIMLYQMQYYFDITEEDLLPIIEYKLKRLKNKIGE